MDQEWTLLNFISLLSIINLNSQKLTPDPPASDYCVGVLFAASFILCSAIVLLFLVVPTEMEGEILASSLISLD